jgi:carbon-monoxide dehydrogenase small subunit
VTDPAQPLRVRLTVNGVRHEVAVDPARRLLDVLREDLDLTGTKESCAVGVCGACSVLVDGTLVSACLMPAVQANDRSVTTIEGIAGSDGSLSPLQEAFIVEGGLQCGACTPGQVVAATALLAEHPQPSDAEIRDWMSGNLCRCTGYAGIIRAIRSAAGESATGESATGESAAARGPTRRDAPG